MLCQLSQGTQKMPKIKEACLEELEVGQSCTTVMVVTDADIVKFAEVTGDINPIHLDEAYAQKSIFEGRIAHGMISAGYISAIFGTRFPGAGSIFLSQSLKFKAPVRINDSVTTMVTITDLNERKKHVTLTCECKVGDIVVLTGEALLLVPRRASAVP